MLNAISKKLQRLEIEDIIWIIYLFLIFFNLYSNKLEKEFALENNQTKKREAYEINVVVLVVVFIIYLYFLGISYEDYATLSPASPAKKKELTEIVLLSAIFFVAGGALALYAGINNDFDEEIGFL